MTENRPYDIINKEEPRGQSVTYKGIPCTARTCVTRLNQLTEENRRLKKAEILANYRGEMIGFATALIDDLGSQTMKEMWDKFKKGKYEEWRNLE